MNYVLTTSKVLSLVDAYIIRALIVMVVWQASYRDVEAYYYTDIVVRWFLQGHKSEIHGGQKSSEEK